MISFTLEASPLLQASTDTTMSLWFLQWGKEDPRWMTSFLSMERLEMHSGLILQRSLEDSAGLDHWGSLKGWGGVGNYSNSSQVFIDQVPVSSSARVEILASHSAHLKSQASVVLCGKGAQLAVLLDYSFQPVGHGSHGTYSRSHSGKEASSKPHITAEHIFQSHDREPINCGAYPKACLGKESSQQPCQTDDHSLWLCLTMEPEQ